jgi:hypothetical protein
MKGFWLGLAVGCAIGAAAVLALQRQLAPAPEALAEAPSAADAGPSGSKPNRRRPQQRRHRPGSQAPAGPVELTAADHKLVWRGAALAIEQRELDLASDREVRSLSRSEIDVGVQSRSDQVVDCIKQARGDAELEATVTVQALVDGAGHVIGSRVRAPRYLIDNNLAGCIRPAVAAMRFAPVGGQTLITVPFNLY